MTGKYDFERIALEMKAEAEQISEEEEREYVEACAIASELHEECTAYINSSRIAATTELEGNDVSIIRDEAQLEVKCFNSGEYWVFLKRYGILESEKPEGEVKRDWDAELVTRRIVSFLTS